MEVSCYVLVRQEIVNREIILEKEMEICLIKNKR